MVQWVQQPGWEGCCGPGQAGRTEAGPGPGLQLVMGLMHRETKSITAVVMVMTMNQVELGLPELSVQRLPDVCPLSGSVDIIKAARISCNMQVCKILRY